MKRRSGDLEVKESLAESRNDLKNKDLKRVQNSSVEINMWRLWLVQVRMHHTIVAVVVYDTACPIALTKSTLNIVVTQPMLTISLKKVSTSFQQRLNSS